MKGRIHSFDTFGTLDGPGIRFILFMQGCALKCQFCHNPDSWEMSTGTVMEVEEVLQEIKPYIEYYWRSGGGITVTGGEPTLQAPFVAQLFAECKKRWGLHTALDTSGYCEPSHVKELMQSTDLVLLDLKQIDSIKHAELTSQPNERILLFANWLSEIQKSVWIRHVLVPGITDSPLDLYYLGNFMGKLRNVDKIEVLPYHRMGVYKWQQLGKIYPLDGYMEPTEHEVSYAREMINKGIADIRKQDYDISS